MIVLYRTNVPDTVKPVAKPKSYWKCQCECGNITYCSGSVLRQGKANSCGCVHSMGNQKIQNWLMKRKINYKKEIIFKDLVSSKKGYPRFDFGVYDK